MSLVSCFRCECCPLYRFLVQRGNLPVNGVPAGALTTRDPSEKRQHRNISTFEEVVLVRSLSEKWIDYTNLRVFHILKCLSSDMIIATTSNNQLFIFTKGYFFPRTPPEKSQSTSAKNFCWEWSQHKLSEFRNLRIKDKCF